ncbi:MAG: YigZ family protein, partial [Saprospiraceae bacterium]
MPDQYLTLEGPSEGYYMDRGSKFLAFAFPAESEVAIAAILDKKRKEHPKASHFCSAFRLNAEASLERSNDDGEPSGSAGKPILGQLTKNNLTNVLIVVVRYFGGSKLG